MASDAASLPKNENLRVYMRHSIRFDNPPDGDYGPLLLTPEGIEIANRIGRDLDIPIGNLYSSCVKRCVQTATEIAKGAGITEPVVEEVPELGHIVGFDHASKDLGIGWYQFFYGLERGNMSLTGGTTIEEASLPIIDRIFNLPSKEGALDIMCSHDSHIVILAGMLFDLKTGLKGENWVGYTEGLFFYGDRDDFTAFFRGHKKRFKNFMM